MKVRNFNTVPFLCPPPAVLFLLSLPIFPLQPLVSSTQNEYLHNCGISSNNVNLWQCVFNSLKFYCSGCSSVWPFNYAWLSDTLNTVRPYWQAKYIEQRSEIIFLVWLYHHIHNLLDCGTRFLLRALITDLL